jgi:hypothetical protein
MQSNQHHGFSSAFNHVLHGAQNIADTASGVANAGYTLENSLPHGGYHDHTSMGYGSGSYGGGFGQGGYPPPQQNTSLPSGGMDPNMGAEYPEMDSETNGSMMSGGMSGNMVPQAGGGGMGNNGMGYPGGGGQGGGFDEGGYGQMGGMGSYQ